MENTNVRGAINAEKCIKRVFLLFETPWIYMTLCLFALVHCLSPPLCGSLWCCICSFLRQCAICGPHSVVSSQCIRAELAGVYRPEVDHEWELICWSRGKHMVKWSTNENGKLLPLVGPVQVHASERGGQVMMDAPCPCCCWYDQKNTWANPPPTPPPHPHPHHSPL